jgi:hypothetical protein
MQEQGAAARSFFSSVKGAFVVNEVTAQSIAGVFYWAI